MWRDGVKRELATNPALVYAIVWLQVIFIVWWKRSCKKARADANEKPFFTPNINLFK